MSWYLNRDQNTSPSAALKFNAAYSMRQHRRRSTWGQQWQLHTSTPCISVALTVLPCQFASCSIPSAQGLPECLSQHNYLITFVSLSVFSFKPFRIIGLPYIRLQKKGHFSFIDHKIGHQWKRRLNKRTPKQSKFQKGETLSTFLC
jgi:hypothetical protein